MERVGEKSVVKEISLMILSLVGEVNTIEIRDTRHLNRIHKYIHIGHLTVHIY